MHRSKLTVSILLTLFLLVVGLYAQELPADTRDMQGKDSSGESAASAAFIFSTSDGGIWTSPSTWVGGVVPGTDDNVVIGPGSMVVVDNVITVASLIVGIDAGPNPGVLIFHPVGAHSLRVTGDLTISVFGILTTPDTGTVTTHKITIGGNLTNKGILDLSTNNNLAGADLVFTNASNNTFGGTGSVNDIRTITINKGTSTASTLDLAVSNFTVQESSIDLPTSGYLTLLNGTFKISGLFSGNHRTFNSASYTIPQTAGIWLNNPNYTVAGQTGDVLVNGRLQVSAGSYNVGTASTNVLRGGDSGGLIIVDGGSLNVSGAMRRGQFPGLSYRLRSGETTVCIAGNFAPCYDMAGTGTGGSFIVQTPNSVPNENSPDFAGFLPPLMDNGTPSATAATLRFGNAGTPGTGLFTTIGGDRSHLVIDTTAGPHTVKIAGNSQSIFRDINIGLNGTLDTGDSLFYIAGANFINNGTFKIKPTSVLSFFDPMVPAIHSVNYSGMGSFSGPISSLYLKQVTLTLDPSVNSIRTMEIRVDTSNIVNAGRITLGNNDNVPSTIQIENATAFDSAPSFDLGTGGQKLIYINAGTRDIGPELNPSRALVELTYNLSTGTLNIIGGDLTLNGPLNILTGVINTGANRLIHLSGGAFRSANTGYIEGTLVRRFTPSSTGYTFFVGKNHYSPVAITATLLPSGSADVAVTAKNIVLAGLPAGTSVSFSWDIQQTGQMTSTLVLNYDNSDIHGSEINYRMWRSTAGSPALVASTNTPANNTVTAQGITDLTGSWGISPRILISISGSVTMSNGSGIGNAIVTLTGGNLTAPLVFQTGPFGFYQFANVEAGAQYTVHVSAKRHRFATPSQVILPTMTSVTDVNFIANPPE